MNGHIEVHYIINKWVEAQQHAIELNHHLFVFDNLADARAFLKGDTTSRIFECDIEGRCKIPKSLRSTIICTPPGTVMVKRVRLRKEI